MNLFSYESRFSQVLLRLSISCWLNLLWFICSLPIVTIGASTTALYSVMLKVADDDDSRTTTRFFKAFKENFPQATRLWLLMLGVGIILGLDGYIVSHMQSHTGGMPAVLWTLNLALLICAGVVYTIILLYVFPLTASVINTDFNMIKNSFLIGIRYLFATILVAAIHFAMFYVAVALFTPILIFGEGLVALLSSNLLVNIIRLCSGEGDKVNGAIGE